MSELDISVIILWENMLFSGEIYTTGKNFTLPPLVTNPTSVCHLLQWQSTCTRLFVYLSTCTCLTSFFCQLPRLYHQTMLTTTKNAGLINYYERTSLNDFADHAVTSPLLPAPRLLLRHHQGRDHLGGGRARPWQRQLPGDLRSCPGSSWSSQTYTTLSPLSESQIAYTDQMKLGQTLTRKTE